MNSEGNGFFKTEVRGMIMVVGAAALKRLFCTITQGLIQACVCHFFGLRFAKIMSYFLYILYFKRIKLYISKITIYLLIFRISLLKSFLYLSFQFVFDIKIKCITHKLTPRQSFFFGKIIEQIQITK